MVAATGPASMMWGPNSSSESLVIGKFRISTVSPARAAAGAFLHNDADFSLFSSPVNLRCWLDSDPGSAVTNLIDARPERPVVLDKGHSAT